jgi:hypothetical protein
VVTTRVVCESKSESGKDENRVVQVSFRTDDGPVLSLEFEGRIGDRFDVDRSYILSFVPE